MTITAEVIADSIGTNGKRITTLQLHYHRFIHAEAKTHRVLSSDSENEITIIQQSAGLMDDVNLSRNASSSRAIPTSKLIEQVRNNPVMPVFWGRNQAGMQAREEMPFNAKHNAIEEWQNAAINAADSAEYMEKLGCHKQIVNRILEPFLPINVIVTATEWDNFFELRDHPDAQPEMQELARCMKRAMQESEPQLLKPIHWHLPYIKADEMLRFHSLSNKLDITDLAKISAARCARVSYLKHDGTNPSIEEDLALFEKLVMAKPSHASPCEHQAYFDPIIESSRNFKGGWVQFRDYLKV